MHWLALSQWSKSLKLVLIFCHTLLFGSFNKPHNVVISSSITGIEQVSMTNSISLTGP